MGRAGIVVQLLIFSIVGVAGTAAHYAVLVILVHTASADAVISSMAGFTVGALVNYRLNYQFTFKSNQRHVHAMWKYFAVAIVGLVLNTLLMQLAVKILSFHYFLSQVSATGVVLLWNYWGNRNWTFFRDGNERLRIE